MKPKAFVTRQLPEKAMERIHDYFDATVNPDDRVLNKEEIIDGVKDVDVLLCLLTDTIDGEVMDAGENLKVISNYAVGFNNIDLNAANERKLPVCITPGVLTETSADMTWALLFAVARRLVEGDEMMRAGKFHGWGPLMLLGGDIYGKTLGVVGLGRIGEAVAKRAKGFDMRVLYSGPTRQSEAEAATGAEYVPLETLLKESDFVSLNCPMTPDTHHLIGEKELALMKQTAYLINTARGPVVDEKALVKALQNRQIAGAGLDVFEEEPKMAEGLAKLDNVVLAPHIASASVATRTAMGLMAAENAIAILEGSEPKAIANPEVLASAIG